VFRLPFFSCEGCKRKRRLQVSLLGFQHFISHLAFCQNIVWSLHKARRKQRLPVLEISHHVIKLNDSIPKVNHILLSSSHLGKRRTLDRCVIEMDTSPLFLEVSNNLALCHSRQVSVVLSVDFLLNVFIVKSLQIVYCYNQVKLRLFLKLK